MLKNPADSPLVLSSQPGLELQVLYHPDSRILTLPTEIPGIVHQWTITQEGIDFGTVVQDTFQLDQTLPDSWYEPIPNYELDLAKTASESLDIPYGTPSYVTGGTGEATWQPFPEVSL